jgi:hypothetical protein
VSRGAPVTAFLAKLRALNGKTVPVEDFANRAVSPQARRRPIEREMPVDSSHVWVRGFDDPPSGYSPEFAMGDKHSTGTLLVGCTSIFVFRDDEAFRNSHLLATAGATNFLAWAAHKATSAHWQLVPFCQMSSDCFVYRLRVVERQTGV